MVRGWPLTHMNYNLLCQVSLKQPRHQVAVKGNSLFPGLVKQFPDALCVAMETVADHDLVVSEAIHILSSFQRFKLRYCLWCVCVSVRVCV